MPNTIFEVVETMHCEPMRDGTGRIRTYTAGEYCTDPFGRDLVVLYANKFKYAPPGVSPKFKGDECDDTLAEVSLAMQSDKSKKKMMKKLAGKNSPKSKFVTGEEVEEDEEVVEEEVETEEETEAEEENLVVDDVNDEESDLVVDDLDEEAGSIEEKPVKKSKKSKKSKKK